MNKLNLTTAILVGVLMIGCTTIDNKKDQQVGGSTAVENAIPYIKPAVILTCTVVLEQALSPQDKVEKAKMINHVSTIVESLTTGQTPTPDQLQKALSDYLPEEKTHWAKYVIAIKDIYAAQFNKINGDTALAVKVLNAIASGCKEATAEYVN